ncbi:hypothetical protein [Pyxidicoccus caerfyrddinensis]|uniref:hypothetical protein n=1 Tax=Pyxidicoccus caerfyrddinensis TaxID=2709663 RepID=UPI0013DCDA9E|nr:hypothetical protein [Pyxidicoccus caerfyrddinensis]
MKTALVSLGCVFALAACGDGLPDEAASTCDSSSNAAAHAGGEHQVETEALSDVDSERRCSERSVSASASDPKHETTGDPNPI